MTDATTPRASSSHHAAHPDHGGQLHGPTTAGKETRPETEGVEETSPGSAPALAGLSALRSHAGTLPGRYSGRLIFMAHGPIGRDGGEVGSRESRENTGHVRHYGASAVQCGKTEALEMLLAHRAEHGW